MLSGRRRPRKLVLWCIPGQPESTSLESLGIEVSQSTNEDGPEIAAGADAIVGQWSDAWRKALSKLDRPACFFHLGKDMPPSLVDFVSSGGHGWSVANSDEALRRTLATLAPERTAERAAFGDNAWVLLEPQSLRCKLLDCSSTGFAFLVPPTSPVNLFAEGVLLDNPVIELGPRRVLSGSPARVRSVTATQSGFRVGCRFEERTAESAVEPVDDPLRALALISRIAKRSSIEVTFDSGERVVLGGGVVDPNSRRLSFPTSAQSAGPFEIAHCAASLDDSRFEWRAAVVASQPLLTLQVSRRIDESVRRHPGRRTPQQAFAVQFEHPLSGALVEAPVADFTPEGLRLVVPPGTIALPKGLMLERIEMRLGDSVIRAHGTIRHHYQDRLGLRLAFSTAEEEQAMRLAWVCADKPGVADAATYSFEEIWNLCTEAGLITPEVETSFAPLKARAGENQNRLAGDVGSVFGAMAFLSKGRAIGYLSAFRAYEQTWYVQHMATLAAGAGATPSLNRAIGELCEQSPGMQYFQLAYYVDNPWPSRVFGGFARRMLTPGMEVRVRDYQRVRTDTELAVPSTSRCREATPADFPGVITLLASNEPSLHLHAMDLDIDRLTMAQVDARYRRLGLERRRRVVICEEGGVLLGAALCELGPIGLNFRELASVCRMSFAPTLGELQRQAVSAELTRVCLALYREEGRPFAMLCDAAPVESDALVGKPFQLAELTARRELLRDFKRLMRLSSAMFARRRPKQER